MEEVLVRFETVIDYDDYFDAIGLIGNCSDGKDV
jgi:hypothetical protein